MIIASLLTVIAASSVTTVSAQKQGKGPGGKPPTEAFAVCESKSAEESCSYSSDRGDTT